LINPALLTIGIRYKEFNILFFLVFLVYLVYWADLKIESGDSLCLKSQNALILMKANLKSIKNIRSSKQIEANPQFL